MENRCLTDLDAIDPAMRRCVLTIGNFDGVHVGHQRILLGCRTLADRQNLPVVAMTFDPIPEAILYPAQAPPPLIVPPQENCRLLLQAGADLTVTVRTTPKLLAMRGREFLDQVVLSRLQPQQVVEGANFFFGRGRSGNVVTLQNMGISRGFGVTVVDAVVLKLPEGQRRVSSTLIRTFILDGRIEDANFCLGREFTLWGPVVPGARRGRLLDFPTANLQTPAQVVPADGVYAGKARIEDREYLAAVSIGNRPTMGRSDRAIEAFLLDAAGDFYGKPMALSFTRRLRGQQKFDTLDALKAQIAKDVEDVRKNSG